MGPETNFAIPQCPDLGCKKSLKGLINESIFHSKSNVMDILGSFVPI
jgi:hypothetical protein